MNELDWLDEAACRGVPLGVFFLRAFIGWGDIGLPGQSVRRVR